MADRTDLWDRRGVEAIDVGVEKRAAAVARDVVDPEPMLVAEIDQSHQTLEGIRRVRSWLAAFADPDDSPRAFSLWAFLFVFVWHQQPRLGFAGNDARAATRSRSRSEHVVPERAAGEGSGGAVGTTRGLTIPGDRLLCQRGGGDEPESQGHEGVSHTDLQESPTAEH